MSETTNTEQLREQVRARYAAAASDRHLGAGNGVMLRRRLRRRRTVLRPDPGG